MEFSNALGYLLTALLDENQEVRTELLRTSNAEFREKEISGLVWICAAAITPVLGAKVNFPTAARELISDVLLPYIKNGYDRPSSSLELVMGATGFILQNNPSALDHTSHAFLIGELIAICEKIAVSRKEFTLRTKENAARVVGWTSGLIESAIDDSSYNVSARSLIRFGEGPPQQELHLAVGEALTDAMLGSHALAKRDFYLLDGSAITLTERLESEVRLRIVNERIRSFIRDALNDVSYHNR